MAIEDVGTPWYVRTTDNNTLPFPAMTHDFLHTTFGRTGIPVHRLGLSASYRPGLDTMRCALDNGMTVYFGFGIDTQMTKFFRDLTPSERERVVLVTGGYNYIFRYQNLKKTLEARLRQFHTERIDVFMFLGVMKESEFPQKARDELAALKETGAIRFTGMSCHDRAFAGRMAEDGGLDVLMVRYNAAHPGAERDIFTHLSPHDPGILSYTATRWTYLLRRPKGWPKEGRLPTAGECYRFVLSNPSVHTCLTAPRSLKEFEKNLASLHDGPLSPDDMEFMRNFGDVVHQGKKWFM